MNMPRTSILAIATVLMLSGAALASSSDDSHSNDSNSDESHGTAVAATESDHGAESTDSHGSSKKASKGGHGASWAYSGKTGPENWGRLSKDYHACGAGAMQSPVDIADSFVADGEAIAFDYHLTPLSILHNGHTVQANYDAGSGITVAGQRYELLQLHFHSPSEHAVEGQLAAMEVHFVHQSAEGELAVVGAMMDAGSENPALRELWDHMPRKKQEAKTYDRVLFNARDLLPADTSYYRYMGSLTTPPCSEGVNWFVLTHPIAVGIEQVDRFAKAVGTNNRPLQPTNHRLVLAPSAGE